MADIYIKRNGDKFDVTIYRGISAPKIKTFATHPEADAFALSKLGKRSGMILDDTKVKARA